MLSSILIPGIVGSEPSELFLIKLRAVAQQVAAQRFTDFCGGSGIVPVANVNKDFFHRKDIMKITDSGYRHKNKEGPLRAPIFVLCKSFAGLYCPHGAGVGASAAINAHIRIDRINVSFLNGAGRAFALAGAASNAGICGNFVSHNSTVIKRCANLRYCI